VGDTRHMGETRRVGEKRRVGETRRVGEGIKQMKLQRREQNESGTELKQIETPQERKQAKPATRLNERNAYNNQLKGRGHGAAKGIQIGGAHALTQSLNENAHARGICLEITLSKDKTKHLSPIQLA